MALGDTTVGSRPTHWVNDIADARRIIGFYRLRWTIEQLFRTMKTKGFDVEALRQEDGGPLEKLVTAILIAAVKVMQLVAERDGKAKRPLTDVFDPDDQPALERASVKVSKAKPKNRRTRIPRARSPMPHGSSQGSAAGPAITESRVQSSCSEASPSSTPSSTAGASEVCESSRALPGDGYFWRNTIANDINVLSWFAISAPIAGLA